MTSFIVSYALIVGVIAGAMAAFFTTINTRNQIVTAIAAFWNIAANPLATAGEHVKRASAASFAAIPETSFADGVVHRLVYLVSLALLGAADFGLAAGRLGPAFGIDSGDLPFDITWTTALAWVTTSGFFAAMSLELRMDPIPHPWDQLGERSHRLCRRISDILLVATLISAIGFYVFGALAVIGIYATFLAIAFMGILGLTLTAAAGIAFWASLHAWATLLGIVLGAAGFVLRLFALIPEGLVIILRRLGYLCMSLVDVPFLGVALPLTQWWTRSRLGKSLGHSPIERPIPWPPIGFFEAPLTHSDPEADRDNLVEFPSPLTEAETEEVA